MVKALNVLFLSPTAPATEEEMWFNSVFIYNLFVTNCDHDQTKLTQEVYVQELSLHQ